MIELNLEVDGKQETHKIPTQWSEVTVEQFAQIFDIDREGMTDIEITVKVVSIFTGVDEDTLYMMSPEEFMKISKHIEFTNTEVDSNQVDSITVDGEEYFLKKDFDKLSMGEVISIELLIKKAEGKNILVRMPQLLCIFLRKKDENGELEKFRNSFMEREEMFKKVSITDVNDIFLFFSDGENSSTSNMKGSLENQK